MRSRSQDISKKAKVIEHPGCAVMGIVPEQTLRESWSL